MFTLFLSTILAAASLQAGQLVFSTAFGGTYTYDAGTIHNHLDDSVSVLGFDRGGNTYVGGVAFSSAFRLVHPIQKSCVSQHCPFVAKLGTDGTLLYSTYVGDPVEGIVQVGEPFGVPSGMVCDPDGNVYITGATDAAKLPQVSGGVARSAGGDDAFLVKLDSNGVLKATMLMGGSRTDAGNSIALSPDGFLYVAVTTSSNDFLGSLGFPLAGNNTGTFVLKIDPKLLNGDTTPSREVVSVIGGGSVQSSSPVSPYDVLGSTQMLAVDSRGYGYLASGSAIQRFDLSGTRPGWTFALGGSLGAKVFGFAVDAQGYSYVSGWTNSPGFATSGAFRTTPGAGGSATFVAKVNTEGTGYVFATYLDDGINGYASGIAVDDARNVYVTGLTVSANYPVLNAIQSGISNSFCYYTSMLEGVRTQYYCSQSGILTVLKPDGSGLVSSTYLGAGHGSAVALDGAGNIYVGGAGLNPRSSSSPAVSISKIAPGAVAVEIDGISNAASFHQGLPYPGGLASMFVHGLSLPKDTIAPSLPLPTELAGVSILVSGVPAPILAVVGTGVGRQQINFQVPFVVAGYGTLNSVELRYNGVSSFALPTAVAPGIFTYSDGSGAMQHALDFSPITDAHPATRGETIIVYATGLGSVNFAVASGVAATGPAPSTFCKSPPIVNVGDVLYSGLTPGFPGLYQMNVRLAAQLPSGKNDLKITWSDCWSGVGSPFWNPPPLNDSVSNTVSLPVE